MDRFDSLKNFDIPHKKPSLEKLEGWRKAALVLNATRRFRYTANLKKRRELLEGKRRFKVGVLAAKAAILFAGHHGAYPENFKVQRHGFSVDPQRLASLDKNCNVYHELGNLDGIAQKLKVSLKDGIPGTEEDIKARQEVFGQNIYKEKPYRGFLIFVWEALHDLTLVVLIICAVVSLAIGIVTEGILQGWYEGIGILFSVLIVVFVTAASDYRQSLQFRDLEKEKKKIFVQVTRGGQRQKISIFNIVVGDVVHLSIGDQVAADGIMMCGHSLMIDASSLTGESEPEHPSEEKPFLLAGTYVQDGSGKMLVTAVGMNTEWGNLMSALSEGGEDETPLQVKLNGVATVVGKIGLVFATLTLVVLLVRFLVSKEDLKHWSVGDLTQIVNYFATAVTIVVVAVPEGLPLAVTLSLAYAMKQMIKDKALIRHLSACETMGSATCICSDKTGTLTTNKMTVVKSWVGGEVKIADQARLGLSKSCLELLMEAIFQNTSAEVVESSDSYELLGSSTETAILRFGMQMGGHFREVQAKSEIVKVEPFNSAKKMMGVLLKLEEGKFRVHWKGASEIVLGMCSTMMDASGQILPLDVVQLKSVINLFAGEALRTLCLAFKDIEDGPFDEGFVLPKEEFTCAAIVGIKDPVRPGVKDAVNLCKKAGIMVRMVTGDNIETAKAIAQECNIFTGDLVVEGSEFRNWSHHEMQDEIPKLQVLARSSPSDKLLLVQSLKKNLEVVSVTGDGTNDAPALHAADIGLAMGISGTEVAKASADVVILDDNFSTIVNVAKWGRSVYINIQKFLQFQLTVNLVALAVNFTSACISGNAPLTAVQLLWVNLIMDTLGALALATEPPYDELMEKPPVGRKGDFINNVMWRNIFGQAIYQFIVLLVLQFCGKEILHLTGESAQEVLNTLIFNSFVLCQVFNELNSRELEKLNIFKNILSNRVLLAVVLFTIVFQVVIVQFLGKFASTVPLSSEKWLICVLIGFSSLVVGLLLKLIPVPSRMFPLYAVPKSGVHEPLLDEP